MLKIGDTVRVVNYVGWGEDDPNGMTGRVVEDLYGPSDYLSVELPIANSVKSAGNVWLFRSEELISV